MYQIYKELKAWFIESGFIVGLAIGLACGWVWSMITILLA